MPPERVGMLSAGQFLSIFLIFIGAVFIFFGLRHKEYERVFQQP